MVDPQPPASNNASATASDSSKSTTAPVEKATTSSTTTPSAQVPNAWAQKLRPTGAATPATEVAAATGATATTGNRTLPPPANPRATPTNGKDTADAQQQARTQKPARVQSAPQNQSAVSFGTAGLESPSPQKMSATMSYASVTGKA